jgi:protein suppressor of PHYA-105 1
LADPVAAAAADAAADAAAAAAWDRVSAAAPSLEAAFLSRFGGASANNRRSIEGAARPAALPPPSSSAAAAAAAAAAPSVVDHGTSALISQQRSDRLAAFAADLGRFSRIGQLVEVARIESGGAASSGPGAGGAAASASAAASAVRGAVFWSSGGSAASAAAAGGASASSPFPSSALPPGAVSPEMVCSCAFDRDDDLLATAGVARRVRIYSVSSLLGGDEAMAAAAALPRRSVRTGGGGGISGPFLPCAPPVAEVRASSKLSCVAWNPYVKPLLLVSGYDGRVTLWDAAAERAAASFDGTERRVWAVDWCGSDAALFASGGDDGMARLWDAGRCSAPAASVDVRANVCSVAFAGGGGGGTGGAAPAASSCGLRPHLLALGAADRRAYVYDIRNLAEPLAVLGGQQGGGGGGGSGNGGSGGSEGVGHRRAVSYVRWAPDGQLISASTDSRLQRWDIDIAAAASRGSSGRREDAPAMGNGASLPPSSSPVVATYRGHVNERNFVGLSISDSDGLVATGSEDDAVYVYCGGLPSPVCRHSFVDNGGGSGGGGAAESPSAPRSGLALPSAAAAAASPPALPPPPTQQQHQPSRRSSRASGRFFVSSLAWAGRGRRLVAADSAGIVKLLELV